MECVPRLRPHSPPWTTTIARLWCGVWISACEDCTHPRAGRRPVSDLLRIAALLALVAASAFFVIGEYSVITARRGPLRARAEAGIRHRVIQGSGLRVRRSAPGTGAFDVYLSAGAAFDVVAASYDDHDPRGDLAPAHAPVRGIRLGVDPVLGAGFVW